MTVAPVTLRRRALTAKECAARWNISEERALTWLQDFQARGYAARRGRYWYPTQRARDLHL